MKLTTPIFLISVLIYSKATNLSPTDEHDIDQETRPYYYDMIVWLSSFFVTVKTSAISKEGNETESTFAKLPDDISAKISEYLSLSDFKALAQTNKSFYRALSKVLLDNFVKSYETDERTFNSLEYLSIAQLLGEVCALLFTMLRVLVLWHTRHSRCYAV